MNRVSYLLLLVALGAPAFLLALVAIDFPLLNMHVSPPLGGVPKVLGGVATAAGIGVCALNLRLMCRSARAQPKHVSPIPLVGTILVTLGGVLGYRSPLLAVAGLVAVAVDPGGSVAMLVTFVRHPALIMPRR